jgi:hypothetical protein
MEPKRKAAETGMKEDLLCKRLFEEEEEEE